MLAYLHSGLLPFNALPSDYLVARAQAVAAHGPLTEPFDFPSRQQWLQTRFESLADQPDWKGVKPCSPHALYRLAHRYDIQDLLLIVKSQIFRCLDVENVSLLTKPARFCWFRLQAALRWCQVAYELFSPLSFDHEEIQSGIFEYLSKHWVSEGFFCFAISSDTYSLTDRIASKSPALGTKLSRSLPQES